MFVPKNQRYIYSKTAVSIDIITSVHASPILILLYPLSPRAIILQSQCLCASLCKASAVYLCACRVYFRWVIGSPFNESAPHYNMINSSLAISSTNFWILLKAAIKSLSREIGFKDTFNFASSFSTMTMMLNSVMLQKKKD